MSYLRPTKSSIIRNEGKKEEAKHRKSKPAKNELRKSVSQDFDSSEGRKKESAVVVSPLPLQRLAQKQQSSVGKPPLRSSTGKGRRTTTKSSQPASARLSAQMSMQSIEESKFEEEGDQTHISEFTVDHLHVSRPGTMLQEDSDTNGNLTCAFLNGSQQEDPTLNESSPEGIESDCLTSGRRLALQSAIEQRKQELGNLEEDSDAPSIQEFDDSSFNSSGRKIQLRSKLSSPEKHESPGKEKVGGPRLNSFGLLSSSGSIMNSGFTSEDSFLTANELLRQKDFDNQTANFDGKSSIKESNFPSVNGSMIDRTSPEPSPRPAAKVDFSFKVTLSPPKEDSVQEDTSRFKGLDQQIQKVEIYPQQFKQKPGQKERSIERAHRESIVDNGELFSYLQLQYSQGKKQKQQKQEAAKEEYKRSSPLGGGRLTLQEKIAMRKSQLQRESMVEPEPINKALDISDIADPSHIVKAASRKRQTERYVQKERYEFEEDDFLLTLRDRGASEDNRGSSNSSNHRAIVTDFNTLVASGHQASKASSKKVRSRTITRQSSPDGPPGWTYQQDKMRSGQQYTLTPTTRKSVGFHHCEVTQFESVEDDSQEREYIESQIRAHHGLMRSDHDLEEELHHDIKSSYSKKTRGSKNLNEQWYKFIQNNNDDTTSELSQFTLHSKPSSMPAISAMMRRHHTLFAQKLPEERISELLALDICRLIRMTWLLSPFMKPSKMIEKMFMHALQEAGELELKQVQSLLVAFLSGKSDEALKQCEVIREIFLHEKAARVKQKQFTSYDMVLVYTVNFSLLLQQHQVEKVREILEEIPILVKNRNQLQFTVVELLTDFKASRAFKKLKDLDYITYKLFKLNKLISLDETVQQEDQDEDEKLGPEFYAREIQRQFAKIPQDQILKQVEYFIFGALSAYRNGHYQEAWEFVSQAPIICNLGLDTNSVDSMILVQMLRVIEVKLLSSIGKPEQAILEASSSLITSLGMTEYGQQKVFPFQQSLASQWLLRGDWALDYYFKFMLRLLEFKKEVLKDSMIQMTSGDVQRDAESLQKVNTSICNVLFQLRSVSLQSGNFSRLLKLLSSLNTKELEANSQFQDFIRLLYSDELSKEDQAKLRKIVKGKKPKRLKQHQSFVAWERFRSFSNSTFVLGDLSGSVLYEEDYLKKIEEAPPQFYIILQYLLDYTLTRLNRILDPLFDPQEAAMVIKAKFQSGDTLYKKAIFKLLTSTDLIGYLDLKTNSPIDVIIFRKRQSELNSKSKSYMFPTSISGLHMGQDERLDTEGILLGDSLYTQSPNISMNQEKILKTDASMISQKPMVSTEEDGFHQPSTASPFRHRQVNTEASPIQSSRISSFQQHIQAQQQQLPPVQLYGNQAIPQNTSHFGGESSGIGGGMTSATPNCEKEGATEEGASLFIELDMQLSRMNIEDRQDQQNLLSQEDRWSKRISAESGSFVDASMNNVINNEEERRTYQLMQGMIWDEESLAVLFLACKMAGVKPTICKRINEVVSAKEDQSTQGRFAKIIGWF